MGVLSFALIHLSSSGLFAKEAEWELFDEYQGLKMYRMEVPGSPLLAYRGEGFIDAPMAKLFTVIEDTPRKPQWMSRIQTAQVIRVLSENEKLEYVHVKLPWPLKDRDFVYKVKVSFDTSSLSAKLHFESVEDPSRPIEPTRIRAHVYYGNFTLTAIDGGRRVRVDADAHADPKGWVPAWAVNIYQKRLPRESIEGLMKQVLKPGIIENLTVKKMLAQPKSPAPET